MSHAVRAEDASPLTPYAPYRVDALPQTDPGRPAEVELLQPRDADPWPEPVIADLQERVLREWSPDRRYGALHSRVGIWLEYPLVNTRPEGGVVVPILQDGQVPIRGRLAVEAFGPGRRVVVLLDVSESAGAKTYLVDGEGDVERISVLEGALDAARYLLGWQSRTDREFGHLVGYRPNQLALIAFGESTWPILEPAGSLPEVLELLERVERDGLAGEGRSDAVCALRLARDWLHAAPPGALRDIVILTSGDLPDSARFTDCAAAAERGERAHAACLATVNRSPCPSLHGFERSDGRSDVAQLFSLARDAHAEGIRIWPFLFQLQRPPRFFRELAEHTGGEAVLVHSAPAVEAGLRSVLERHAPDLQIRRVLARNVRTGDVSENLLTQGQPRFEGALPLAAGPNDIEILVESDRGTAGLLRFRVYSTPALLPEYLARLREQNEAHEARLHELATETDRLMTHSASRDLEVKAESDGDRAAAEGLEEETPAGAGTSRAGPVPGRFP